MPTVFCPNCSDFVALDGHACSRCGSDLPETAREEDVEPPADSGSRLEFPTGSTFANRYTIIERIGSGGMGVVYKAIDTMLDDEVALKVIQPALAGVAGYVERFRREVRVTRQITHPNICRFHDIGEDQGILYVSMEWIEGETLRDLLEKTGMLREARALEIAEKIALALEAAHDKSIIHRDLKPANVMIDRRGNVVVLDFGLAIERGADEITETGVAMGTPAYMSPEQSGLESLGPQADLYALGLILREMLTGARLDPVPGLTPAIRSALDPLVVPTLESLLAERPEDRCPSATEARRMLRELLENPAISSAVSTIGKPPVRRTARRLLFGALGGVGIVAGVVLWVALRPPADELHPEAARFLERGLHYIEEEGESMEGLKAGLGQLNHALDYEPESARIWAAIGRASWLEYDLTRATVYREEAERAARRAYEIDPTLPQVLNVRALGFLHQGQFEAAARELEKSLEAEADSGATWLLMGAVRQARGQFSEALEAFRRAEELRPDSYAPQLYLGLYHQALGEYRKAAKYYEKATELKPDSARSWSNLGAVYLYTGRFEEAVPLFERALEVDESASTRSNLGTALYYLERYEDSVDHYRRAVELQPDHAIHRANLGDALFKLGRNEEARGAYREAADLALIRARREPLGPDAQNDLALYCAKAGDESCALNAAKAAAELQPRNAKTAFNNAVVRCVLRLDGPCLDWLERAVKLGTTRSEIRAQPELERLANHTRFRDILELAP